MKKFYSILFYSMNSFAQLTTTTCPGIPAGTRGFRIAVKNECSQWLNDYPVTVQLISANNANNSQVANGRTSTNSGCSPSTNIAELLLFTDGPFAGTPAHYVIKPGYSMPWYENLNYYIPMCCTYDSMPAYSTWGGHLFSTSSPIQSTYPYTGSFTTMPGFTFTVTNPYLPQYSVQGKSLDMSSTKYITRCVSGSTTEIPFNNTTNVFGTTGVKYKLVIYNSDANKNILSIVSSSSWTTNLGNYIDNYFNSLTVGNYYVIEISARSSCSTGNGAYVRGHFRFLNSTNTEIASFTINNSTPSTDCNSLSNFFNCQPIIFNKGTIGNFPVEHKIELKSTDASCNVISTGINYTSSWTSAAPTTNLDLRTLTDVNGKNLNNTTGKIQVKYSIKNGCGVENSFIRTINITAAPVATATFKTNAITKATSSIVINGCTVPANTQIIYYDGSTNCGGINGYKFPMQHSILSGANEVGRTGTVFDLSTVSPGTGSNNYTVTVRTEKWDGSNWQSMNYNNIPENFTGIATIPLNSLLDDDEANPYYLAFGNISLTPNGSYYRITIKVENECGFISNSQIIKLNTTNLKRESNPNKDYSDYITQQLKTYPNPFTDKITIELPKFENYALIQIFDINGKELIKKDIDKYNLKFDIDTKQFNKGVYIYKIDIDEEIILGKLIK